MLPMIAAIGAMGLLAYASLYDMQKRMVQLQVIILLFLFGFIYLFTNGSDLFQVFIAVLVMVMLFGGAFLYGMGAGDMLVFIAISLFFNGFNDVLPFMILFVFYTIAAIIYYVVKNPEIKKGIMRFEFPLIPTIFLAFSTFMIFKAFFIF